MSLFAVVAALALVPAVAVAAPAGAPIAADRVPLIIIDGGLGDARFYVTHWFGETQDVSSAGTVRLLTSSAPQWWNGTGAPDTYLLTASDASGSVSAGPIGVAEIAWALDRVAERHPVGKAVLVAQGAAGLQARAYVEDLGVPTQSSRADVVGLVLLGTPSSGLTLMATYPDLDVWAPYAAGAGLTPADLTPGSTYLAALDRAKMPGVLKSLVIQGVAVMFGVRETDGAALRADSVVATGVVVGPLDYVLAKARASESWNLGKTWLPATKKGGATLNVVDGTAVERLALARGYAIAPDVRASVKTYYQTWFAAGAPVTHTSTRLVVDVSGSMAAKWGAVTKLDAARRAAGDFAAAMAVRQSLPAAAPEDIGLVVFNEGATLAVATTSDPAAIGAALDKVKAADNTDVGKALRMAVDSFATSPRVADKYVVLLSDGVNTAGLDKAGILAGPVADAKARGIRVDTIALGGMDSSDAGFLAEISSATNGTFRQARDLFELRRDFLRARYSKVGTAGVDIEVPLPAATPVALGRLDDSARLLEVAVVPDGPAAQWELLLDGKALPTDAFSAVATPDGVLLLAVTSPKPGSYSLRMVDAKGSARAHVFTSVQADAFRVKGSAALQSDFALPLLVGAGGIGLIVIITVVISGMRGRAKRNDESSSQDDDSAERGEE